MVADLAHSPLDRRLVTDAVVTMLRSVTGKLIGVAGIPVDDPGVDVPEMPYGILYPLNGGGFSGGMLSGPDADAELKFQVTSVGETWDQTEWMGDRVRAAFLARDVADHFVNDISLAGWKVICRDSTDGPGMLGRYASPTPTTPQPPYTVIEQFTLYLTPG